MMWKSMAALLFSFLSIPLSAEAGLPITWTPLEIVYTISAGKTETQEIYLTSDIALGTCTFVIPPKLQPFVSIDPATLEINGPGKYPAKITFNIPADTEPKTYKDKISIINSYNKNQYIKTELRVVDHCDCSIPLTEEKFSVDPRNNNVVYYNDGTMHLEVTGTDQGNNIIHMSPKGLPLMGSDDFTAKLSFSGFETSTPVTAEGCGSTKLMFYYNYNNGSEFVAIEKNPLGITAWPWPDPVPPINIEGLSSVDSSGTLVIKKTGSIVTLYAEGFEKYAWSYQVPNLNEPVWFIIVAGLDYNVETFLNVDLLDFCIKDKNRCLYY